MLGQPAVLLSVCPLGFLSLNASRDPAHRSWQWALSEGRHRSNNQLFVSRGVGRHTEPLELTTVTAAAARPSELNTRFVSIAALQSSLTDGRWDSQPVRLVTGWPVYDMTGYFLQLGNRWERTLKKHSAGFTCESHIVYCPLWRFV